MRLSVVLASVIALLTAFGLGFVAHRLGEPLATPPGAATTGFTMSMRLGANIFQQTAAEYRACCLTVFASAKQRLTDIVQNGQNMNRLAVILDLDETVIDNGVFESFLYKERLEYSDERWVVYEEKFGNETMLIPGAIDFLVHAEKLGVTPVFISNRNVKYTASTVATLQRLGINPEPVAERLLLKDQTSDKTARRDEVAKRFQVVMLIGDNLRDFSEVFVAAKVAGDAPKADFDAAIAARNAQVDREDARWGKDWFILPNPVYGEWEKLIGNDPGARLRPTAIQVP